PGREVLSPESQNPRLAPRTLSPALSDPSATIPRMHRCFFLCLAILALQAAAPEVEITAEPHHHLILENQSVRVFNVDVPPHTVTLKLRDGETRFAPATFAHIARNLTDRTFRNVTVEILEDESLRHSAAHWE